MSAYVMLFLMASLNWSSLTLTKKFQLGLRYSAAFLFQANFFNAIIACVCLFVANGLKVNITPETLIFSFCFGILSTLSVFFLIYSYAHISMTLTSLISMAGSIVVPMLFGFLFNKEPVSIRLIISAIVMLAAVILPVAKDVLKTGQRKFILFLASYFIYSGLPAILSKLYAQSENVADSISYFFLTNMFMFFICGIACLVIFIRNKNTERLSPHFIMLSGVSTIISLVVSYLSVAILAIMPVSVYSVINSSLALSGNALISRFLFKEKMTKTSFISLFLAILSFFIGK